MCLKMRIRGLTWIVALVACCVFAEHGHAQSKTRDLPKFRANLYSGKMVEGSKGSLTPTMLTGTGRNGQAIEIPTSEITSLEIVSGSKAVEGALIGAGGGLLTGLSAIAQVSLDDEYELDEEVAVGLTLGLTVGFALIGAAIGSSIEEWESVRVRPELSIRPGGGASLRLVCISF